MFALSLYCANPIYPHFKNPVLSFLCISSGIPEYITTVRINKTESYEIVFHMYDLADLNGILAASKFAESGGQLSNALCKTRKQLAINLLLKALRSGTGHFLRIDRMSFFSLNTDLDATFNELVDEGAQGNVDVCVVPGSNYTQIDEYTVTDEGLGHVNIKQMNQKRKKTQHTTVFTQPFILQGKELISSYLKKIGYDASKDCHRYVGSVQYALEAKVADVFEATNQSVMILIPTQTRTNVTKQPKDFKRIKKSIRDFVRPQYRKNIDDAVCLVEVPVLCGKGFLCTSQLVDECRKVTLHQIDATWAEFTGAETRCQVTVIVVAAQSLPLPTTLLILERLTELKAETVATPVLQLSIKILVDPHDFQVSSRHFHPLQPFGQYNSISPIANDTSLPHRLCSAIQKQESSKPGGDMSFHLPLSVLNSTETQSCSSCIRHYTDLVTALDVPSVRKHLLGMLASNKVGTKSSGCVWTFTPVDKAVNEPNNKKRKHKKLEKQKESSELHLQMLRANPFVTTAHYETARQMHSLDTPTPICAKAVSIRNQVLIDTINKQALPFDLIYGITSFDVQVCVLILPVCASNDTQQLSPEETRLRTSIAIYSLLARLNELNGTPTLYVIGDMARNVQYGRADLRQLKTIPFE